SSIAGCMYRVLQTTGPDGKNLLKLLPISKPSGSFVPLVQAPAMPNSPAGNVSTPVQLTFKSQLGSSAAPSSVKIFQSPNPGKVVLARTLDKQEGVGAGSEKEGSVPSAAGQGTGRGCVQDVAVSSSSPQSGAAYMLVNTKPLPVTVKSPVLPSGHHLQIPADAEVKSVPASLLPPAIQRRILAAAAGGADGSRTPTVIYVSPVNTVRTPQVLPKRLQAFCPQTAPEVPKALLLTAAPEGAGSPGPAPPQGRQRRHSPMKWIVQEAAPLPAPCLIPVKSSNNVASKILKTLSDTTKVELSSANILPPCSGGSQAKLAPLKDNALVMYNGKVYLLTKRGSDILSAQAERQTPSSSDASLRKETPQRVDSAVNKITSKVVNLVLSKSKGVLLAQRDPKPRANPQRSPPDDSRAAPVAPVTPSAEQQDPGAVQRRPCPAPPTGHGPVPATGAQWPRGRDERHPPPGAAGAASPRGEHERALSGDWPKVPWEHMDSLGKVKTQPPEQPHWRQYLELRKKFGLSKEERVYLRRIPVTREFWEEPEGRGCSSDSPESKRDSCSSSSLDVETRNWLQECVQEEKVVVDLEEDLTRKRKIKSSPLSDSGKRRRNSARSSTSPSSEPTNAPPRSVSPPPASPEPSIPTGSCGASQGRDSEPGTPPACGDSADWEMPEPVTPGGAASLLEGSFRDDAFPAAPPDLDETIRDEKIRRLKQLLREREAALEEMRRE
ncbi:LRIF1 factor, partial [Neopipo cinnamomea]|nr:LRIF1 factor [Neopipo cinnamomea]